MTAGFDHPPVDEAILLPIEKRMRRHDETSGMKPVAIAAILDQDDRLSPSSRQGANGTLRSRP